MTLRVGVGLVGCGFVGQLHADAFSLSALASVRAVASQSADRAADFAARWRIPAWHTDYRELVAHADVDLVCVAAPNWLHRDIVIARLERARPPGRSFPCVPRRATCLGFRRRKSAGREPSVVSRY